MIATLAVHDKRSRDEAFLRFIPLMEEGADDDRNVVKKAVNWALRQVGKRNMSLNHEAICAAQRIALRPHASARWIASDAIRELESKAVRERMMARESKGE
jgi:3-methyladenine DNA glycosylase AlkD